MDVKIIHHTNAQDEQINLFEEASGFKLPAKFRVFVKEYDGAELGENYVKNFEYIKIERFLPVTTILKRRNDIEGFNTKMIPIAECPSGDYVYISAEDNGIYYWDHENEGADLIIAHNFESFLEKIIPDLKDYSSLKPDVEAVWVDPDFKPVFD